MPNGQDKLDKEGCAYGQKLTMRTEFQSKKLNDIEDKQDKIINKLDDLKETQDKYSPFTRIGIDLIKYIVAAIVGAGVAILGFLKGVL